MAFDYYATVPLSMRADSESVIIYRGDVPTSSLTLIVYFHGISVRSMRWYLQQKEYDLKQVVDLAQESVVLVAPSLSSDAQAGDDFTLKSYLPSLAAALQKANPDASLPDISKVGNIKKLILAAHSGGGKVMLATAQKKSDQEPFAQLISECWGFDCLYGPKEQNAVAVPAATTSVAAWQQWQVKQHHHRELQWAEWLEANSSVKFWLYYTSQGGTETRSNNLKELGNRKGLNKVVVEYLPGVTHPGAVLTGFGKRLPQKS